MNWYSRNSYSSKTLMTVDGQFQVHVPCVRESSFEPQIFNKHQARLTAMDEKIHYLYAKDLSIHEFVVNFKEMYDTDVSPIFSSKVTDAALE